MFSVIILSYNSGFDKMSATIDSVLGQDIKESTEIIIADDGSKTFDRSRYEEYFLKNGYSSYQILEHENMGIVGNVLDALKYCKYDYVKPIGAGDLLHKDALRKVHDFFIKNNCVAVSVGLRAFQFTEDNQIKILGRFNRPCMMPSQDVIFAKDAENVLVYEDYMSGASLFYTKEIAIRCLEINTKYVRSCEDLMQINILLDGNGIGLISECLVDYEYGSGVSTNEMVGKAVAAQTGESDHDRFYSYIGKEYSKDDFVKKLLRKRKIESGNWIYRKTSNIWYPKKLTLKKLRKDIIISD